MAVFTPPSTTATLGRCDSLCAGFDSVELSASETGSQDQALIYLPPPSTRRKELTGGGPVCREVLSAQLDSKIVSALNDCNAWVLDIDLDFFSTGKPFRSPYSEVK